MSIRIVPKDQLGKQRERYNGGEYPAVTFRKFKKFVYPTH